MKKIFSTIILLMLIPFSHISKAQGVDLLSSWFISMVAQQATAQIDQVNSGPNFGNYVTYAEAPLQKNLESATFKGSQTEKEMLLAGPVYVTKDGLKPVGNNHPYRLSEGDYRTDLLFLITTKLDQKVLKQIAEYSVKTKGVLVMRGLVNDSVADTIQAVTPLLETGALIKIDPRIEERFGHTFRGKAPQFINTLVRKDGSYGCDGDTKESKCFGYQSVSGIIRTFGSGLDIDKTVKLNLTINDAYATTPVTKAYKAMTQRRFEN